jgi:hypothetical protein
MSGYAARHDAPSVGVLDPLTARALVLEAGPTRVAFVSLDLGRAPTRESTARIRDRAAKEANVAQIFLVASHTHHGPVLELDDWPTPDKSYVRSLEQKIGDLIVDASKTLQPARLGVATKEVALNRNRQSKRADPPVDRELLVLRVEGMDGKPVAHAVNFAAHPTMTESKLLKFSADYPGAMAERVERETGVPCLFLQGAAGDLSARPPEGVRGPAEFGRRLGDEVLALAKQARCDVGDKAELRARHEEMHFKGRVDVANPLTKMALSRAFFPGLVAYYEREFKDGVRPDLTVALLNDQIGFVGVSGEFFCDHAMGLKRRARLGHLLFLGYCNDYHQYYPTIEAAGEGGYGTQMPEANAELGAGERVADRALLTLYRMRGKVPE